MRGFWKAFARNRLAVLGGIVVICLVTAALLAPVLAPWDPYRPDVKKILDPPSGRHLLGTDQLGRDVLSRMLHGARVSLAVGFVCVGIGMGNWRRPIPSNVRPANPWSDQPGEHGDAPKGLV